MESEQEILDTPLFSNLRKLINVVDELRDVGLQQFISLPRIAVLGTQSAGKSSLLENIVGLDFLPRGSGVVTRRPLELRLVHISSTAGNVEPWAVFGNDKNTKYHDFDKVRENIQKLTDQVAGTNKGIVNDPITLTIYSNNCPDLTIIDLPGITRIPLKGSDQNVDIEKVTKEMAAHYVKDERTIILTVTPGNADISTSEGLHMARNIDPTGSRTIGVITKIDIMDQGTDARSVLTGQDVPLKLGFVGVVNRSQKDIDSRVRVKKALEAEQKFFSSHPIYSSMDPKYLGTKALTQKLTTVLFQHIRNFLPAIIKEISEKIQDCESRLRDLGPSLPEDSKEKMHLIWNMITDFTENFKNSIKGKYDSKRSDKLNQELSGGAVIKMMFNELFYDDWLKNATKATREYSDKDIDRAIILHQGDSLPGFPSIDAFMYLINPQLEKLKEPSLATLNDTYNFLENLAQKLIKKVFARFPSIQDEIQEMASKVLQQKRDKAKEVVENIIESEQNYLFTNDPEYLNQRTQLIPPQNNNPQGNQQQPQQQQQIDPKKAFIDELRLRVDIYFKIIIRNVRDSIPKAIGFFLVKAAQDGMQETLYMEMMKNEEQMTRVGEPTHIIEERRTINNTLHTLRKAEKALKRDPDLASSHTKASSGNNSSFFG